MDPIIPLGALTEELLDNARSGKAGRAARTAIGGADHVLRQTVIALAAGSELAEHETPGEATLFVLAGHVELRAGSDSVEVRQGELLEIPPARHSVHAVEDSAFLLSAVPREFDPAS